MTWLTSFWHVREKLSIYERNALLPQDVFPSFYPKIGQ